MKKVIFLDRDGTINVDHGYVHSVDRWEFAPGAITGLQRLQRAGFALAVITNQSGIARHLYTEADMQRVHTHMVKELTKHGIQIDAIAFCPHDRDSTCECRKPRPGMTRDIEAILGVIDYTQSWTIGDKFADVGFGRAAGTKTVLIQSRYWTPVDLVDQPDLIVGSLEEAAQHIVPPETEITSSE